MDISVIRNWLWKYVMPYLCLFGILTNLINVVIFNNRRLTNSIYKFFLIHSIIDLIYLLLSFVYFFSKYSSTSFIIHQSSCLSYLINFIELYVFYILTSSLAIMLIFVEIIIALKRLFIVANLNLRIHFKLCLISLFSFSILLQIPYSLSRQIVLSSSFKNNSINSSFSLSSSSSSKSYIIVTNEFANQHVYMIAYSVSNICRGLVAPVVLLILNLLICFKYKKQIRKKMQMKVMKRSKFGKFT